ncbi:germination-specific N-acetylmuramoyl-L-alanine amidase [Alicyclobacillus contaminans]|uniref:N-acetylmuramoyl-L-alanine amidase n=1 Tax=Alicyclobacillus contaminans TaxID=392016 RepID=UPI000404175F|nr:N-acetylmuramoyl-L-alanine amidase [Alicyclobacillus contaminans]GMA50429.1 germination-specific N-acetylmuramoyl-L-alanine amidase [Alicyclobacillus contaminans]
MVWKRWAAAVSCMAAFVMMGLGSQPAKAYTLSGRVVVVDAGHGGPDGGARTADGRQEKVVTLAIANWLRQYLQQAGAIVYMTRVTDDDLASDEDTASGRRHQTDLRNRTRFVLSKHPDAFVSIHCNAMPSPVWRGAHTIYMEGNAEGERLAKEMQARFKELLLPTEREADDMDTLYLLKRIPGPAVLAEVGFLSNPEEAAALHNPAYQRRIAFAMYLALMDEFQAQHVDADRPDEPQETSP